MLAAGALTLSAALSAAQAQQSFDEGSFGGGSFETVPAAAAPETSSPGASGSGDGFGGSFGTGEGAAEGGDPGAAAGQGGGSSASFDPEFTVPGGAAAPAPPVQPAPPPPQPVAPPQGAGQQQGGGITIPPEILAFESRDFGVPATQQLRQGDFHAPTPTVLPGGYVATTEALANAMQSGQQFLLIDVLGADYSLPGAQIAQGMANPGGYQDRVQQQVAQWLGQLSGGDRAYPVVVYCSDPMCWLSYNAALRAIAAGYTEVYWYRGGMQAWRMSGLKLVPTGF
jgi:PQQ-dependent catabolism-associated CXXCW motif protein